jgi:NSS family neurotransmitter:Na+ symporter
VGWVWGRRPVAEELSNGGTLHNGAVVQAVFFLLRFVTPVLVLLILLRGLKII